VLVPEDGQTMEFRARSAASTVPKSL